MKITPFSVFVSIFILLVVFVVFTRNQTEGFIAYNQDQKPLASILIPQYNGKSSKVTLIYDNIYFDSNNGNLIEVDGSTYGGNVTADSTGKTITALNITVRSGNASNFAVADETSKVLDLSKLNTVASANTSFIYNTQSKNTDQYCVIYLPYNLDTVIHVINTTSKKHVSTSWFNSSTSITQNILWPKESNALSITGYVPNISKANGTMFTLAYYDTTKTLYQICDNVLYDIKNGWVIMKTDQSGTINIYQNDGTLYKTVSSVNQISNTPTTISTPASGSAWNAWMQKDTLGQNIVLYLPLADSTTMIAIIRWKSSSTSDGLTLLNVSRFDKNGLIANSSSGPDKESGTNPAPPKDSPESEYYKKYWFNMAKDHNSYLDDYMLKTQIVPPVCPSCPSCTGNGACTNCGGQGGSGTLNGSNASVVGGSAANADTLGGATLGVVSGVTDVAKTGAGVITGGINTVGGTVNKVLDNTTEVVEGTLAGSGALLAGGAIGAAGLAKDTVGGAAGLAKDTVGGAAGMAKDTVTGTVGLAKDTVKGTVDLAREIVGGVTNGKGLDVNNSQGQGKGQQGQGQGQDNTAYNYSYTGQPNYGTNTQYTDPYSYYGQLPTKTPTNFMPVTADFSNFGR